MAEWLRRIHWRAYAGIGLLLALAACLRLYQLGRNPLWYDEVMYTLLGRSFLPSAALSRGIRTEPAFYVLLWAWEQLGTGEFWLRLHAVIAGLLTVYVAWLFGKRLAGPRGIYGAALVAVAPLLVFYCQDAKMYEWVACLELTIVYLAFRYCEGYGRWFHLVLCGLLSVLLVHMHVLTVLFVGAVDVFVFFAIFFLNANKRKKEKKPPPVSSEFRRRIRKVLFWTLVQVTGAAACIPYLLGQYRLSKVMSEVVFWAPPPTLRSLWVTAANLLTGYSVNFHLRVAAVAVLGLLIVWALIKGRGRRIWLAICLALALGNALWLFALSKGVTQWPLYVDRYMIGSAPLLLLLAGVGVAHIGRPFIRYVCLAAALFLVGAGLRDVYEYRLAPEPRDHLGIFRIIDTRGISQCIREQARDGDVVWHVSWDTFLTTKWYLPELTQFAAEMHKELTMAMSRDEIGPRRDIYKCYGTQVETAAANVKRVWLVMPESEPQIYPRFIGILAWLDAHADLKSRTEFGGRFADASLYLYELRGTTRNSPRENEQRLTVIGTDRDGRNGRQGEIRLAVNHSANQPGFVVENNSSLPLAATCQIVPAHAICEATGFDRALGANSQWRLQMFQQGPTARLAYTTHVPPRNDGRDILQSKAQLEPGTYDIFVERVAGNGGYPAISAPMTLRVAGTTFSAPGMLGPANAAVPAPLVRPPSSQEGWQWVRAGTWTNPAAGSVTVEVIATNTDRPETIPAFSRIVFRKNNGNAPMPFPPATSLLLQPGESKIERALWPEPSGYAACVVSTNTISGVVLAGGQRDP